MTTLEQNVVDLVKPFIEETRPALESLLVDTEQEIPISSLPPELLSEIFMLCCQPKYNAIGGVDSQAICPLRLAAVCKAWRDLAWTTSRLWSVIILMWSHPCAFHLEGVLDSWIKRAGAQPLSIRYEAQSNSLLSRLIQETSKWMNVTIKCPPSKFCSAIETYNYFPLLEHLSIRVRVGYYDPASSNPLHCLDDLDIFNCSSLPNITRLHVPGHLQCFKPNLMWSQLRTFSVSCIDSENLCNILDLAKFLEVFSATFLDWAYTNGDILQTVNHSYLRCLVFKEVPSGKSLNELLSTPSISTPNLEDLTIEMNRGHERPDPNSTFLSKFITSLHQLRRIKVKYYDTHDPKWVFQWLLNIPSLTELDVQASPSAIANIVSALGNPASTETTTEYLPLLVNLTITQWDNLIMKDIPEMLAYRSSGVSPSISRLKSASLHQISESFSQEDFDAFQMASLGDLALKMIDRKGCLNLGTPYSSHQFNRQELTASEQSAMDLSVELPER
ncbi:uncharacterized protein LACBIDRAFT_322580 [Laccaria bicolor S238N-H82]|uniref:Predicted protein n=1 Tax=Laccaria bicolor (strain S238N-H82 / ATCC MYA-4686) TaxID=486041 RepID=B0CWT5_LACBS|nr:uncharacterized protein LACBIDRAFT_322580 [Laccaria bicolor S238N-H82]EDR13562.1 predicted protein [Laccaria bicolor S238N-H82]|eukprot:XP_001876060.1 predicted protein [Laccaria bicolor S238N-H82]